MQETTLYHHRGELQTGWSFWENYRPVIKDNTKKAGAYDDNLVEIFSFSNLNQFAQFWNCMPYDQSSNLIYFTVTEHDKIIQKEDGKQYVIEGLNLFRQGVKPAWEDPRNSEGYHFQCE